MSVGEPDYFALALALDIFALALALALALDIVEKYHFIVFALAPISPMLCHFFCPCPCPLFRL